MDPLQDDIAQYFQFPEDDNGQPSTDGNSILSSTIRFAYSRYLLRCLTLALQPILLGNNDDLCRRLTRTNPGRGRSW